MARSRDESVSVLLLVAAVSLAVTFEMRPAAAADGSIVIANGITTSPPAGWSLAPRFFANAQEIVNVPPGAAPDQTTGEVANVMITTETRIDHADALHRLKEIASETQSPSTFLDVCGWPALQRRNLALKEHRGESDEHQPEMILRVTTAVAVDAVLVRLEGLVPPDATSIADQEAAFGRSLSCPVRSDPSQTQQEINNLTSSAPLKTSFAGTAEDFAAADSVRNEGVLDHLSTLAWELVTPAAAYAASPQPPQKVFAISEMEVAVSSNGQYVVVAGQSEFSTSQNGGVSFPFIGFTPYPNFGDASVAFGQSGNFYLANINKTAGCPDATFGNGCATGIARSTDNGKTFPFLTNAVTCATGAMGCFPDQEHIAADRFNAAPGGLDQVYSVWRNFPGGIASIVCSSDSGANWTMPLVVDAAGGVPRVTVGSDGFVYVIYISGGNIMIKKYSSCSSGLTPQAGFPKVITSFTGVVCPVPGLDRCNDGNVLASHMVAVDDTDPMHLYMTYANNTSAPPPQNTANENVLVRDSTDGGVTWSAPVTLHKLVAGRRFMPWICAQGGAARVSWYDRRAAVGGSTDDLTDYFCGSASRDGGGLTAGAEIQLTDSPDPECAAGQTAGSAASWPCSVRAMGDSESCTVQPQLAGRCCDNTMPNCPGSQQPCDFSSGPACPMGETCNGGGGCPKYGDYNGNACGAGRVFTAWASAVPPSGITASGNIDVFVTSKLADGAPDLSITKTDSPDPVIAGTMLTYTLTVTNSAAATALNVTVKDAIPANTTFQSASSATFSCSGVAVGGTGTLTCTNAFMAQNEVDTITLVVNVNPDAPKGSKISNTATVSSDDTDPNPGDNSAMQSTTVDTLADLADTKIEFPSPLLITSEDIHYIITTTNAGPSNAANFVLSDAIPTHTTFRSLMSPAGFTCTTPPVGGTGTITCKHPSLPVGTFTFTVVVRLDQDTLRGTRISDTATVTSDTFDPTPQDNTATVTVLFASEAPALGGAALLVCGLLLMAAGMRLRSKGRLVG
jgi:uncharacterized repeat protein (TIGR01451 family)